ncbi:maleate cis-trans isomerase family protein [Winogradskya consettensis]|uniref:maleate cis-trans isomerase family protein n=1 Tax=Winogradskya consettensis TaxID=113560 RepID=UPI001BB345E5|nr:hypothetical protein [Actinoplanes consettensis]
MATHSRHRFAVVVPPANAAVEPETRILLSDRGDVYSARFPVLPGKTLRERLETYNKVLPETLGAFGTLRLDAAVIACSGSHYLLGPAEDRELCARLSREFGYPVVSATVATLDLLAALGDRSITLVSPYEPWLTELSVGYWQAAGLTVDRVIAIRAGAGFSPYDVTTDELVDQVERAAPGDTGTFFLTGTGMFTLDALDRLARGTRRTVLTSNIAGSWWVLHHTAAAAVSFPDGPLRRLADERGLR